MTLGLPANFLFEVMKRYLQAQGVMTPLALVMAVGCAVNVRDRHTDRHTDMHTHLYTHRAG